MRLFTGDSDQSWEAFGRDDPYYGVFSQPKYHGSELPENVAEEFFATGERHVEQVMQDLAWLPGGFRRGRILDFGCGVGRLLIPFARQFEEAVGIDVSVSMLKRARHHVDEAQLSNVTLLRSDDEVTRLKGEFDLIHSFIVFQHIPTGRGMRIARNLIALLREGGVGALHFTFGPRTSARYLMHRMQARAPLAHNLANLIRGRPWSTPMMQTNYYEMNRVLSMLMDMGCHYTAMRATSHSGQRGAMVYFRRGVAPSL